MDTSIDFGALGPDWARGCAQCRFGLVSAPDLQVTLANNLAVPLYVQRAYEYRAGLLVFCACRAGHVYRRYLDKVNKRIDSREEIIPATWNDALWAHCASLECVPTFHVEETSYAN